MIANIDKNIGKLRKFIKEVGIDNNTIFIFMTDNGTSGGCAIDGNGFVTDGFNAGMRGLKGSEYDGGHRVPFFIHWPEGGLTRNVDVPELTANIDIMPTLTELCDLKMPDTAKKSIDGKSLVPLLKRTGANDWPERTILTDSQRLVQPIKWRKSSVMTSRWRLINGIELYDIIEDPGQKNNMADKHPDIVSCLRNEYEKWWEKVSAQFDEEIPISIGSETGKEICLTSHDWRGNSEDIAWNQGQIRQGKECFGHWEVEVTESGKYVFELSRWPKEEGRKIRSGIKESSEKDERIEQRYGYWYHDGKALPINTAVIKIDKQQESKPVNQEDLHSSFTLDLKPGIKHLQAFFISGQETVIGSYYVYIRKI